MRKCIKILVVTTFIFLFLFETFFCHAKAQEHIRRLDDVRSSMTKLGNVLPDMIKKAEPAEIRTLERTFEINNYAMMTIESYLKMVKIALSSSKDLNQEQMNILLGWLRFIYNYSEYDLKYFDEALAITKNKTIIEILNTAKNNITDLRESSRIGLDENKNILVSLGN